jgi:PAS domain S-box-containing protein
MSDTVCKSLKEALAARTRALEESQAELTAIMDNAPFTMMVVDRAWRVQKVNDRGSEFIRADLGNLLGLRCGKALCCIHASDVSDGCGFGPDCQGCLLRRTALDTIKSGQRHYEVEATMAFAYQGEIYEKVVLIYTAPLGIAGEQHALVILQDITGRKRAEEALRLKDNAIAASINAVAMADLEGRLTYVNDAFLQLWGYDDEQEVLGRPAVEFWQSPGRAADVVEALRTTGGWRGELTAIKEDGTLVDVQLSASLVGDEMGDPICVMASFVDITDRKRVEEAYHALVEHSLQGLCIVQAHRVVFANAALAGMFGYTVDELLALSPEEASAFLTSEGRAFIHQQNQARQAGDPVSNRYEIQVYTNDGDLRWTEQFVTSITYRGRPALQIAVVDITDRKRAEGALRQTTERLRIEHEIATAILAAQSPEAIARAALTRLRHLVPCQRASIAEVDLAQARGRRLIILDEDEVRTGSGWRPLSDIGSHLTDAIQHGRTYMVHDIATLARPSSLERQLIASGLHAYVSVPLLVQDTPIGALNMASTTPDFFQPEHLEILEEVAASLAVALQQARLLKQAQQDAETKALLLHEVNHRVKNNLDAIIGLLYVERRHAPPEVRDVFQPIVDDLTQRIMGLAQVHRMLSAAEWQPLALSELTERLIDAATQTLTRDVTVRMAVSPSSVRVSPAQAHHLALVLSELVTNTLKYAMDGRDVVRVNVQIAREDDGIILTYRNDGPDYPEEVLRLERHNAGLDIVQNIVRRNLRGELALRNENGAVAEIRFKVEDNL